MTDETFTDLRKIRNVVNNYFKLNLEDKNRSKEHVMARLIFLKLVDVFYEDKDIKPKCFTLPEMMGLNSPSNISHMRKSFRTYPGIEKHYGFLKHYVIDNEDKLTLEQIKQMLIDSKLTLSDVIDAVIDLNGLIGVGLVSLGSGLNEYCRSKIVVRDE